MNFLGNHDVKRIASNLDNPAHYTHAMVVLMLMKGIPCLYYGDEFGMEGSPEDGTDEHSGGDDAMRRPMPDCSKPNTWPAIGISRLALNKKLIKIRKEHPVFAQAGTQDMDNIKLIAEEWPFEQITVVRETEDEVGVLVFNCADHEVNPWPEVQLPAGCIAKKGAKFVDLLAHTPETFLVNDGGKIYAGPCGPNSVKVLLYQKVKPKPAPVAKNVAAVDPYTMPPTAPATLGGAIPATTPPGIPVAPAYDPYAAPPPAPMEVPAYDPYATPPPATTAPPATPAAAPATPEFDPYAAPPPPPPPSFLDQWKSQNRGADTQ